jgi:anti-sigma regulatory factor (Ser/Thr protein kinase)
MRLRFISTLMLFAALALVPGITAIAQSTQAKPLAPVIRVGYYDAKHSCWRDESGLPRGIFIDTLNLLADKEGWNISYIFAEWNQLLDGLKAGTLDLIPAIVRTPEREASLRSFFEAMTERLTLTCTGITSRFSLETDFHQAILVPSAAFPLALILSELAFNAIRHGRGSDGSVVASIRVHVHEDGSGEIVVSDCGTGFPPDFDVMRTPGLGYRLISALVSQLKGKLTTHTNSGATVRITIPRVGWTVSLS